MNYYNPYYTYNRPNKINQVGFGYNNYQYEQRPVWISYYNKPKTTTTTTTTTTTPRRTITTRYMWYRYTSKTRTYYQKSSITPVTPFNLEWKTLNLKSTSERG
jgi:hypothetical protein